MSNVVVNKYQVLIKRLYNKTQQNELDWSFLESTGDIYVTIGTNDIHLRSGRDSDGEPLEIVEIRNASNQILDSFNDTVFGTESTGLVGLRSYYILMTALREAAVRQAMGADKALDKILDALDDDPLI